MSGERAIPGRIIRRIWLRPYLFAADFNRRQVDTHATREGARPRQAAARVVCVVVSQRHPKTNPEKIQNPKNPPPPRKIEVENASGSL